MEGCPAHNRHRYKLQINMEVPESNDLKKKLAAPNKLLERIGLPEKSHRVPFSKIVDLMHRF